MVSVKLLVAGIALLFLFFVLTSLRKGSFNYKYLLWWLSAGIFVAALGAFPHMVDTVGHYLNVGYPPILVVIVAILLLLVKMLIMDVERTRHEYQIKILTQKVVELEAVVNTLYADQETSSQ